MKMDAIRNNSWVFLFSLIVFGFAMCMSKLHLTTAADTISFGDSITGNQTIISKGENFVLGFFRPGNTSRNYYIGIWYKKVSVQTAVWVANRDAPILHPSSSKLTLLADGNLVLLSNSSKKPVWSTNLASSSTLNTTQAVLGNDGNLVLRDASNPLVILWQSFDYPTDTWLPGGKLGFNKRTNQIQQLTSWRSREDPARGSYNLEIGSNGTPQYIIYWNKSKEIWKSGEWDEQTKTLRLLPEMRLNHFKSTFTFSLISNANESYFTYSIANKSTIHRFVMDISCQIKEFTWTESTRNWTLMWLQPKRLCDVYSPCGAFGNCNLDTWKCECLPGFVPRSPTDSAAGCDRKTTLQCTSKVGFSPIQTSNLPDNPRFPNINGTNECKSACQGSCGCIAYAFLNNGCRIWDEDIINFNQFNTSAGGTNTSFNLKLASSDILSTVPISSSSVPVSTAQVTKRMAIAWKIIAPVLALVAIIIGILGYMLYRHKANKRGKLKELHGVLTDLLKSKATYNDTPKTNTFNDGKTKGETHELQIFNLACLSNATKNFCLQNKLGEGGFGPVYKGKLRNEQEIAVKRLSKSSGQGIEEFKNEVVLISKLQHRNLVKLLGCCVEGEEYMLIYEYMPKRSLDSFLFDPMKKAQLSWDKRFDIIGGIARGLLYLHRDSRLRVIHRDLKVSNILLDDNMTPKISDFGMARIFGGDQIIDNTKRVVGTFGYMSPEYVMGGTFSEKSDVFSFGVLILEITWSLWNEGKWSEVMDEGLGDLYSQAEAMKCVHIGLLCVQNRAIDRPTMAEVDNMLSNETDRPAPKEPPYTFPASSDKPGSDPVHCSNNNVTFTAIEGR